MTPAQRMTPDELILQWQSDPNRQKLLQEVYWDRDLKQAAERFLHSGEFAEVVDWIGIEHLRNARVLDLGAGRGIASFALARSGASVVHAVEPDPSPLLGRGAILELCQGLPVEIHEGKGESLPLPDGSVDLIYVRQTLHHLTDLKRTIQECCRLLAPGGTFIACREHVAQTPRELEIFQKRHPTHSYLGNEHAFPLRDYEGAIREAGLDLLRVAGPWESAINAAPRVANQTELPQLPKIILEEKFGLLGQGIARVPGVASLIRRLWGRHRPGALYSFLARKSPA